MAIRPRDRVQFKDTSCLQWNWRQGTVAAIGPGGCVVIRMDDQPAGESVVMLASFLVKIGKVVRT